MKVMFFGEAMVEFSQVEKGLFKQAFAGDVLNTAVYMSYLSNQFDIHFVSAAGDDAISNQFESQLDKYGISTSWLGQHPEKTLGSYLINVDERGERSFSYWRDTSAAKSTFSLFVEELNTMALECDVFYFSGISLAILNTQDRKLFWEFIEQLKQNNKTVVFDSNYRPKLWSEPAIAKQQIVKAVSVSDIVFAGVEDFSWLLNLNDCQQVLGFFDQWQTPELIVKDGANKVVYKTADTQGEVAVKPVTNVIDTTSAGDSFNGAYLAQRLSGATITEAVKVANRVAAEVIQHKGAIVNKAAITNAIMAV